jgi:hypothetical protein
MLSGKLIRLIESHSDEIAGRVVRRILEDPELLQVKLLPEAELRDRCEVVLKNLGGWLAAGKGARLIRQFEQLGKLRFEEHVPLHEAVRAVQVVRNEMIRYLQDHGFPQTTIELYAEEEFEFAVTRFFDELVCHLVSGYEEALRQAAHIAKPAVKLAST